MRRTVLLFGKGELAIRVAAWFHRSPDHKLQTVVPVVSEPSWTDSLIKWCVAHEVGYVESGHFRDIPRVDTDDWTVDLAFSTFYDKIIPLWFIRKTKRIPNLHNSPLPRYRGVNPINWALKNRERTHGVTIHDITPDIDAGPIVSQVLFSVYPDSDEVIDVYERAVEYGYALFTQTMPILDRIEPKPQNEAQATYYSRQDEVRLGERSEFTRALSPSEGGRLGPVARSVVVSAGPAMTTKMHPGVPTIVAGGRAVPAGEAKMKNTGFSTPTET